MWIKYCLNQGDTKRSNIWAFHFVFISPRRLMDFNEVRCSYNQSDVQNIHVCLTVPIQSQNYVSAFNLFLIDFEPVLKTKSISMISTVFISFNIKTTIITAFHSISIFYETNS